MNTSNNQDLEKINQFNFVIPYYDYKLFNNFKNYFIDKLNSNVTDLIQSFIGKEKYKVFLTNKDRKYEEKIHNKVLFHSNSLLNDWLINDKLIYLIRKINHKTIDLNNLIYKLIINDDGYDIKYQLIFYDNCHKIVYQINFENSTFKLNEKQKNILKNPIKYNSNTVCDYYLINCIHKYILKKIKYIKTDSYLKYTYSEEDYHNSLIHKFDIQCYILLNGLGIQKN